jgi:hypothetical protein
MGILSRKSSSWYIPSASVLIIELLYIIITNTLLSFYYVTDMGEHRNQLMIELFPLSEDQPNKLN